MEEIWGKFSEPFICSLIWRINITSLGASVRKSKIWKYIPENEDKHSIYMLGGADFYLRR
jgi:hypothetical protein